MINAHVVCEECKNNDVNQFFWHCQFGWGTATCLKCKVMNYFDKGNKMQSQQSPNGQQIQSQQNERLPLQIQYVRRKGGLTTDKEGNKVRLKGEPRGVVVFDPQSGKSAWSFCNVKTGDRFERKLGRDLAIGRLTTGCPEKVPYDVERTLVAMQERLARIQQARTTKSSLSKSAGKTVPKNGVATKQIPVKNGTKKRTIVTEEMRSAIRADYRNGMGSTALQKKHKLSATAIYNAVNGLAKK